MNSASKRISTFLPIDIFFPTALTLLLKPLSKLLLKLLLKLFPYLGCAEFTPVISITLVPQF